MSETGEFDKYEEYNPDKPEDNQVTKVAKILVSFLEQTNGFKMEIPILTDGGCYVVTITKTI